MLDKANKENQDVKSQVSGSKRSVTLNKFFTDKKTVHSRMNHSLSNSRTAHKVDKSVGYIRRMVIDSGNPRYAASKHSSFLGGLTTGQHVRNRFKVPVDVAKPITAAKVDEELFGAEGTMYNTLHHGSAHMANMADADEDNGILRPDELLYNDREGEFFAKMRGASREPARESDPETTTVATSAIYPMIEEAGTSLPTAFYSKKVSDYSKRLQKE